MRERFLEIIKDNLSEVFENIEITDSTKFIEDLGFESVAIMQVIIEVEQAFGIEFNDVDFEHVESVGLMYSYIEKKVKDKENET